MKLSLIFFFCCVNGHPRNIPLFIFRLQIIIDLFYNDLENVEQSFQDGCNEIVAACTSSGVTPSSNSPSDISTAIKSIYNNGYTAGRTQGQNDVKNNPSAYGLYKPPVHLTGKVDINNVSAGQYSRHVTFSSPFGTTPRVTVSTNYPDTSTVSAYNITRSSFDLTLTSTYSGKGYYTVTWTASTN